jgi:hypothetical protein
MAVIKLLGMEVEVVIELYKLREWSVEGLYIALHRL